MTGYWDHKTKPFAFVVKQYSKIISPKRCYKTEVAKYFNEPVCLTPKK